MGFSMRTQRVTSLFLLGLLLGATSGCRENVGDATVEASVRSRLDPNLSLVDQELLIDDIQSIGRLPLEVEPGSQFARVFGGQEPGNVLGYLNERVQMVLAGETNPYLLISDRWGFRQPVMQQWTPRTLLGGEQAARPPALDQESGDSYLIAENVGIILWMMSASGGPAMNFRFDNREIPIESSRVGIIRIGGGYRRFPRIDRIASLVHEARHSDCTGGISQLDLQRFRNRVRPQDTACGHLHVACPPGHLYAGQHGCEDRAWGAYGIQAVFLNAVRTNCARCTRVEKQVASAGLLDALSRILVSMDDIQRGRYGNPDMSSAGVRN